MSAIGIVEGIEQAFAGVKRDPEQSLHQAQLTDQGMGREITAKEWHLASLLDTASEWYDVDDLDIEACDAALSHMTPLSWRFYIPAYMRLTLKYLDKPLWETDVPHWTLFSLMIDGSISDITEYRLDRFRTLSKEQHSAVREFLIYVRDNAFENPSYSRDAEIALQNYWDVPNAQLNSPLESGATRRSA